MSDNNMPLMLSVVLAIVLFILGAMMINYLKPEITTARNANNLNCASSDISSGGKFTCLIIDTTVLYFFIVFMSLIGGILVNKYIT